MGRVECCWKVDRTLSIARRSEAVWRRWASSARIRDLILEWRGVAGGLGLLALALDAGGVEADFDSFDDFLVGVFVRRGGWAEIMDLMAERRRALGRDGGGLRERRRRRMP